AQEHALTRTHRLPDSGQGRTDTHHHRACIRVRICAGLRIVRERLRTEHISARVRLIRLVGISKLIFAVAPRGESRERRASDARLAHLERGSAARIVGQSKAFSWRHVHKRNYHVPFSLECENGLCRRGGWKDLRNVSPPQFSLLPSPDLPLSLTLRSHPVILHRLHLQAALQFDCQHCVPNSLAFG
ncbi:hypothetical protein BC830DRAFT_1224298, partial [Chytriomyces sp. MP71]